MSDTLAAFEVLGIPAPQGSHTAILVGGKPRMIGAGGKGGRERHVNWRTAVAEAARELAEVEPFDGALTLDVTFRFPMPASRPKKVRALGTCPKITAPDLDKLVRALGDSLTAGGLIRDDARFVEVRARKFEVTGWTGAEIVVGRWTS